MKRLRHIAWAFATATFTLFLASTAIAQDKPNILVIFGDDIGYWNVSYNNRGMMGYQTPNIDRLAREGMIFTDYYAEQSCTAGRAAFITGQHPFRNGLTKVGLPSAPQGRHRTPEPVSDAWLTYSAGDGGLGGFSCGRRLGDARPLGTRESIRDALLSTRVESLLTSSSRRRVFCVRHRPSMLARPSRCVSRCR